MKKLPQKSSVVILPNISFSSLPNLMVNSIPFEPNSLLPPRTTREPPFLSWLMLMSMIMAVFLNSLALKQKTAQPSDLSKWVTQWPSSSQKMMLLLLLHSMLLSRWVVDLGFDLWLGIRRWTPIRSNFDLKWTRTSCPVILIPIKALLKLGGEFSLFCHMVISWFSK